MNGRHLPTADEFRAARSRVVDSDKARQVMRGVIASVLAALIEAQKKRVGDGGVVRSVPMAANGDVLVGGDFSAESIEARQAVADFLHTSNADSAAAAEFLRLTTGLRLTADGWAAVEIDWSETESFREIQ